KCCRTIFAIQLQNKNPNLFGLKSNLNTYQIIKKHLSNGFTTAGIQFYWHEMINQLDTAEFYYFENKALEIKHLDEIKELNQLAQEKGVLKKGDSKLGIFKYHLINKYPELFK